MKAKKASRHKSCRSKEITTESLKWTSLSRVVLVTASLLFPFGLLFAFAQQQSPNRNLAADFMKADRYRRAQIRENLLEKGRNAVPDVLPLLDAPDVEAQVTALAILERAGAGEALVRISTKTTDSNAIVRAASAKALGGLASDRAIPTLFTLLADPDRSVRINAVFSLARLKAKEAVPTLRATAVRTDADTAEREAAIISLGNLHALETVTDLVSIAVNAREQEKTRGAALSALAEIRDPKSAESIVKLTSDASEVVRFNAAAALGGVGGSQAETALIQLLRDQKQPDFIRIRAAWALRNIGTDRAIQELIHIALTEKEFIAMHAVRVLIMSNTLGGKAAALSLKARSNDAFVLSTVDILLKDAR